MTHSSLTGLSVRMRRSRPIGYDRGRGLHRVIPGRHGYLGGFPNRQQLLDKSIERGHALTIYNDALRTC